MTTVDSARAENLNRPLLFGVGALLLLAAAGLGTLIYFRTETFDVDVWWNGILAANDVPFLDTFSYVMNFIGAGWFGVFAVPIVATVALLLLKRPWSAAFFIVAEVAAAGVVQVLKHVFGRARPEEIIVISDFGSFPSGHVANAATLATAAFILFPRLVIALVGVAYILLMALSRTVLHAHWLTDTVGGALIGIGVVLIVAGIFAPKLIQERPSRQKTVESAPAPPQ